MKFIPLFILMIAYYSSAGQQAESRPSVFMDCKMNCHTVFIKQEIDFINYKRDRQGADVYLLATSQSASAGSREVQLIFNYLNYPDIDSDTIKYYVPANVSNDDKRHLLMKHFKKGLLPVILTSSLLDDLDYTVKVDSNHIAFDSIEVDPWNYWAFNVRFNFNTEAEESFKNQSYFSRVSASRVTEKQKLLVIAWYNLDKSSFTLSDAEQVESTNKRFRTFMRAVKSIDDHWSVGVQGSAGSSSFGNTDFESRFKPAIEYNIYPYSENSTKRFSFLYGAGYVYNNYTELTVFDKLEESLWTHGLDIEFNQTQQWGNISWDIEFDQYLHDLSLYSISFNPNVQLNIVKGLRLDFGGFVSFVGDRINITKELVSDQDIILQNRQLDTNYSYYTYFGFNYQFGSANNNIVNPRF